MSSVGAGVVLGWEGTLASPAVAREWHDSLGFRDTGDASVSSHPNTTPAPTDRYPQRASLLRHDIQPAQRHSCHRFHTHFFAVDGYFVRDWVNVYGRCGVVEEHVFFADCARLAHGL